MAWVSVNWSGQAWNLLAKLNTTLWINQCKSQVTHIGSGSFEWASASVHSFVPYKNPDRQAKLRSLPHLQTLLLKTRFEPFPGGPQPSKRDIRVLSEEQRRCLRLGKGLIRVSSHRCDQALLLRHSASKPSTGSHCSLNLSTESDLEVILDLTRCASGPLATRPPLLVCSWLLLHNPLEERALGLCCDMHSNLMEDSKMWRKDHSMAQHLLLPNGQISKLPSGFCYIPRVWGSEGK